LSSLERKSIITIFIFWIYFLLLCLVGVLCGIHKSSYNISNVSYLNSPPPPFSFISPTLHSRNSFNRSHFSTCMHMYTVFTPYSPPSWFPPFLPAPTGTNPSKQDLFHPPVLWLYKRKKVMFLFIGSFLMTFSCTQEWI
jgi:hypothetical protein